MALSVCMAEPDELDDVLEGAQYLLLKRSGRDVCQLFEAFFDNRVPLLLPGNRTERLGQVELLAYKGKQVAQPERIRTHGSLIAGFAEDGVQQQFEKLLHGLSFSGIGGKRSAGLGRFRGRAAYRRCPASPARGMQPLYAS